MYHSKLRSHQTSSPIHRLRPVPNMFVRPFCENIRFPFISTFDGYNLKLQYSGYIYVIIQDILVWCGKYKFRLKLSIHFPVE